MTREIIKTISAAIVEHRNAIPGTPKFLKSKQRVHQGIERLAEVSQLELPDLAMRMSAAVREWNDDRSIAENVVPGNAYPDAFIDFLSNKLKQSKGDSE